MKNRSSVLCDSRCGLTDPHDPIQALYKSADYLRDLWAQFGNLGLAAAAYNGGSGRVQAWLEGRGGLPNETRQYEHIVTGVTVETLARLKVYAIGAAVRFMNFAAAPSRSPADWAPGAARPILLPDVQHLCVIIAAPALSH